MKIKLDTRDDNIKDSVFVDREDERKEFWDKYKELCEVTNDWPVTIFNYWGMGGVGKSKVLWKIYTEKIAYVASDTKERIPAVYISLSQQDTPISIMNRLVVLLKEYGYEFPLYETALFQLSRYNSMSCNKEDIKTLEEKSTIISALLDLSAINPITTVIGAFARVSDKLIKSVRIYLKNKEDDVGSLDALLPDELENRMPDYFSKDFKWNLENNKSFYPCLFFLDKLEALRKPLTGIDDFDMSIDWLKEKIISKIPNVIWVFSSREKLEWSEECWEDSIFNVPLLPFDSKLMKYFFSQNDMHVESLEKELYELTAGIPLYLSICYELYQKIKIRGEELDISKFEGKQKNLINTYLEYLTESQTKVLCMLSCVGEWDNNFIHYISENCSVQDFWDAYNVLLKKSYIQQSDKRFVLHQVITEQIFSYCKENVLEEMTNLIWNYIPHDKFTWLYTKYIACKIRSMHSDIDFDKWWLQDDLNILKDLSISTNINGFEKCYQIICEYTKGEFEDSCVNVILSTIHISNLLKLKRYHNAQSESNHMIRICKTSKKSKNIGVQMILSQFCELKAQALDAQNKVMSAFNIRKKLCEEPTYDEIVSYNKMQNLVVSYRNLKEYDNAIKLLKEIILFRKKHIDEDPEDYVKSLLAQAELYKEFYDLNIDDEKVYCLMIEYVQETINESHRLLPKESRNRLETDLIISKITAELRMWKVTIDLLENSYETLLRINNGRNQYIDEVRFTLAIAYSEIGKAERAIKIFEDLEVTSNTYEEGSDRFALRCKLEKGIALSINKKHSEAKACLKDALEEGMRKFQKSEFILVELEYTIALQDYFLGDYDSCIKRLNDLLPYCQGNYTQNNLMKLQVKRQIINCELKKQNGK